MAQNEHCVNYREIEKQRDMIAKREKREQIEFRQSEKQRDLTAKQNKRADPAYRQTERQRDVNAKKIIRTDELYRQTERQRDVNAKKIMRTDELYRQTERQRDVNAKKIMRTDELYRQTERQRDVNAKKIMRTDELYRQTERQRDVNAKKIMRTDELKDENHNWQEFCEENDDHDYSHMSDKQTCKQDDSNDHDDHDDDDNWTEEIKLEDHPAGTLDTMLSPLYDQHTDSDGAGRKLTAGELQSPQNVDKIVRLDEGFRVLKTLRGSPPYWESAKKDIFAMIRQLGCKTYYDRYMQVKFEVDSKEKEYNKNAQELDQAIEAVQNTAIDMFDNVAPNTQHQEHQDILEGSTPSDTLSMFAPCDESHSKYDIGQDIGISTNNPIIEDLQQPRMADNELYPLLQKLNKKQKKYSIT
ncbi:putative leucine-rich repeat-containing protein DDB_G0290503 [Ptychodera flava]|uniref:putative leucine-rich repeat-containing protein DDB_G0290503 n=1 Tax=Ptychodera flava TaxID=63121 RepID=UPI003969DE50